MKEDSGEPIARLTPLVWSCIGNSNISYMCFANKTK